MNVNPGQTASIRLRLSDQAPAKLGNPFGKKFAEVMHARRSDADEFYKSITPANVNADAALVMRSLNGND